MQGSEQAEQQGGEGEHDAHRLVRVQFGVRIGAFGFHGGPHRGSDSISVRGEGGRVRRPGRFGDR